MSLFLTLVLFGILQTWLTLAVEIPELPEKVFYDIDDSENHFNDFIVKFERNYEEGEYEKRFEIFKANLKRINELNTEQDLAVFGVNKFADRTYEEAVGRGYFVSSNSSKQLLYSTRDSISKDDPDNFDWRDKNLVTPVKDQKQCGSCYIFSAVGSIEAQYAKKYGELISFSEQQALDCLHVGGCDGGTMIDVMKAFANETGIETTESYPYEGRERKCREADDKMVAKVAGGIQLDIKEEDDLQVNLLKLGPLSVALDASDMFHYKGGILKPTECTDLPDHAVLLVGYGVENGTKFWSIKNSWSEKWGEKGYLRLLRGVKACAIGEYDTASAVIG